MKKWHMFIAALVLIYGLIYFLSPHVLEAMAHWECSDPLQTESCLNRMRAIGHLQSQRGNLVKAQYWYERGAEQGDPVAMFHLGWVYEEFARANLLNAHRSRKQPGQALGDMPEGSAILDALADDTIPPDLKFDGKWQQARSWYRESAANGFSPSMNNLAYMEMLGLGGPPNLNSAYYWFLSASESGNPISMINIPITQFALMTEEYFSAEEFKDWSMWKSEGNITPDLAEPTLARTRSVGFEISASARSEIREAAMTGSSVRVMDLVNQPLSTSVFLGARPLARNSSLRTFSDIVEEMKWNTDDEYLEKWGRDDEWRRDDD